MQIETPDPVRFITEYEFTFNSGVVVTVALCFDTDDMLQEDKDKYTLHIAEKPSFANPEELTPAEKITVFKHHLATINERTVKQRVPSIDERIDMQKLLIAQMPKTIQ